MMTSRKFLVLLVDDEPSLQMTYRLLLEREGYDVVACSTFGEAVAAIEKQRFDVVLCDYFLEEQHTGLEVVSAARRLDPQIPAVVLTGFATAKTSKDIAGQGVVMMLKPVAIPELLATTSNLLKKNRGPSEPGSG